MALMSWSNDLSVDVSAFDNHHKRLIDIINELHDAMLSGKVPGVISKTLKNLRDYTKYHFGEEERTMQAHGYPEFAEHKALHDRFVAKVNEQIEKYESGALITTIDLMNFLRDWLKSHIMGTDKRYSSFFGTRKVA